MPDIFRKVRLGPKQLRTVADRRFGDAEALRSTGQNARANGAMYLAGFVIECLLKAQLLKRHRWLQNAGSAEGRSAEDRRLWSLVYRSHDLDVILDKLPDLVSKLAELKLLNDLRSICARWTIYARYSPMQANIDEARKFLDQVKGLKPWL